MSIKLPIRFFTCLVFYCLISAEQTSGDKTVFEILERKNIYLSDPHICEAVCATLKKDSTNVIFFSSTWNSTFKYCGPLSDPRKNLQNVNKTLNKDLFTIPTRLKSHVSHSHKQGVKIYANFFLKNVIDLGKGELLGLLHLEYMKNYINNPPVYPAIYRIGLCYSRNSGDSWTFCGDIIGVNDTTHDTVDMAFNIGGAPYLIIDGFIYVYFNEKSPVSKQYPSVARAELSSVVSAARASNVTKWLKYNKNSKNFDQDGISGLGSPVINREYLDVHSDATYCNYLKKYLLIVRENSDPGLFMYISADGIEWSRTQKLASDNIDQGVQRHPVYPFFVSLSDGSNSDMSIVGKEFYVYFINIHWPLSYNWVGTDLPLNRLKITVKSSEFH